MRQRIALWICPALGAELAALRSGNTKTTLENGRLLDEIERLRKQSWRYLQEVGNQARRADAATSAS